MAARRLVPATRANIKIGTRVWSSGGSLRGDATVISLLSGQTVGVRYDDFAMPVTTHLTTFDGKPCLFLADVVAQAD